MPSPEILHLLEEARNERPDLARTLDLHLALAAAGAEAAARIPADWPERARCRLRHGLPALDLGDLELDWRAVERLARQVCEVAARHEPAFAEPLALVASLIGAAAVSPGGLGALVARYLVDREAGGVPEVEADPDLFDFVMSRALHPFLAGYAAAAAPLLEGGPDWLRGDCPVCGGPPDFAALEGEGGRRRLLCARCDAEWAYRRVGCPFCGNEEPASLGYFHAGGGAYCLYVCERCKGYLKTIDLRETWQRKPLAVERVLTVGLDVAAVRQGYGR